MEYKERLMRLEMEHNMIAAQIAQPLHQLSWLEGQIDFLREIIAEDEAQRAALHTPPAGPAEPAG